MSGPSGPALSPEKAAEDNGQRMLITGWVFTALTTLFVAGRIFSRFQKLGKIDTGDYLVLLSLVRLHHPIASSPAMPADMSRYDTDDIPAPRLCATSTCQ
jgi:hypothetical protein